MTQSAIRNPQSALPRWAGLAVSAVALLAYLFTLSPTVNFLDSGELITVGATAGVAHPPGYPLYTLLVILAAAIPIGDTAVRVNLVSALGGALAVGLFYALMYEILAHHLHAGNPVRRPTPPSTTNRPARRPAPQRGDTPATPTTARSKIQNPKSKIEQVPTPQPPDLLLVTVAAGMALLLAASLTFWNWATQAKMYTLHFAFVAGLVWGALRVRRAWRGAGGPGTLWPPAAWPPAVRALILLAAATGLTFTNHYMSVWLLPGLAVLLLWPGHPGAGDTVRHPERDAPPRRWLLRTAPYWIVAGLAPLLLYLYLPLRAAAHPLMNWGSADNWGDFWRHITVWQFRVYIGQQSTEEIAKFLGDALVFAAEQLGTGLGAIVLVLAIGGVVRLARQNRALLVATLLTTIFTLIYTLNYQIREVIVYYVPMYMMIILWAGVGLDWLLRDFAARLTAATAPSADPQSAIRNPQSAILALTPLLLAVLALGWNAGRAGHRDDGLAEAYAHNQFKTFAPNAVVISDNWDLVSPSYYLQHVRGERPDLIIIDKGLTRYPFYLDYMDRQFAPVLDLVRDEEARYRHEERRWVNGEPYDQQIGQYYVDFLRGIVTKSQAAGRPVYFQWADPTHLDSEAQQVASGFQVHPEGLAFRVDAQPFTAAPPDPAFDLRGILTNPVPKDEVAHSVIDAYPAALDRLAAFAQSTNHPTEAQQFAAQADSLRAALGLPAR